MSTDQNKTIARRIVDEAWTKHNPSILDTLEPGTPFPQASVEVG